MLIFLGRPADDLRNLRLSNREEEISNLIGKSVMRVLTRQDFFNGDNKIKHFVVKIYANDYWRENHELHEDIDFYCRPTYEQQMQDSFGRKVNFMYPQPQPNPLSFPQGSNLIEQMENLPDLPYQLTATQYQEWKREVKSKKDQEDQNNQKLSEVIDTIDLMKNGGFSF